MKYILIIICLTTACLADTNFLASYFGDHMLFQAGQGIQNNVWGWTTPDANVNATDDHGNTYSAVADVSGKYMFKLEPMDYGTTINLSIVGSDGEEATISDAIFGDLFLCGGQSNMQFVVSQAFNGSEYIKTAQNDKIRVFTVGQGTKSKVPLDNLVTIEQTWDVASPKSVGGDEWLYISAVCYFFGLQVQKETGHPVGLLSDNWGGTTVEAWSSQEALSNCPKTSSVRPPAVDDSHLFNAMINPILDVTLKAIIWYQAESNIDYGHTEYACRFPALITDWREKFSSAEGDDHDLDLPFIFVHLAAYKNDGTEALANLRYSQLAAFDTRDVGYVTAMDLGDIDSPYTSIHPRDKETIGKRLWNVGCRLIYDVESGTPAYGPVATFAVLQNDKIEVTFDVTPYMSSGSSSSSDGILVLKEFTCPASLNSSFCKGYQVFSKSGGWIDVKPKIGDKDKIILALEPEANMNIDATDIVLVRYAWSDFPAATTYSDVGLPAMPFVLPVAA